MSNCFWAIILIFLSFAICINTTSESNHHHHHHLKPHTVLIGTIYCPSCFHLNNLPKPTHYFITVECWKETGSKWRFRHQVRRDSHGGFKLHLHFPFPITKCCFSTNNNNHAPAPAPAASATCTNPRLVGSRNDGTRVFSAGLLALGGHDDKKTSQFSNPNPVAFLPPLPRLPPLPSLPSLPRLPPLPGIPFLPPAAKPSENQPENFPFPPNPFNLPNLFPPNPLQMTPPVTVPPLFPLPDAPPLLNLPPLPALFQSPPPPSPPPLPPPLQLPPFPFQPTPGLPGVPPAAEKKSP